MSQFFSLHPTHPQGRLVAQACAILREGGLIVYPTDASYARGWQVGAKAPMLRAQRLRRLDKQHYPTVVCRDLSELAIYAKVDNVAFRLLRSYIPGPYTFILPASREVPRRLLDPRRRSVGLRVPAHPIVQALLEQLGEPMMSTTLLMPGDDLPLTEPQDMLERIGAQVDLIIDGGTGSTGFTTIVDLTGELPRLGRQGLGDVSDAVVALEDASRWSDHA